MFSGHGPKRMEGRAFKLPASTNVNAATTRAARLSRASPSYHGNTLAALAPGGHAGRRAHVSRPY